MRAYPAFAGFYGMEETIERIVGFFRHAAQGLEEAQTDSLAGLGPVERNGKSSLAEAAEIIDGKSIRSTCSRPAKNSVPVFEVSPQSVRSGAAGPDDRGRSYGIPRRRLTGLMSPWCYKRLRSFRR